MRKMRKVIFLATFPLIWIVSILPFRALYALSDLAFLIIYYVVRYRRKTVASNISKSIPHLSQKERFEIEKKFYHYFCDMFLEMIRGLNISEAEIRKRYVYTNIEVLQGLNKSGKGIALMFPHYSNYEWTSSLPLYTSIDVCAIYKKTRNKYFDDVFKQIRSRFGVILIEAKESVPTIIKNAKNKKTSLYFFLSDQTPSLGSAHYWGQFMGIETPIHVGAETIGKRYDMNIVFLKVKSIKRGHFEATFEILSENPKEFPNYQISDKFINLVEQQILEAPEFYLWTHKRWKHKKLNN